MSLCFLLNGLPSMVSPKTLKILPRVGIPTGTFIGDLVRFTSMPLERPSVGPMARVLTSLSPMEKATSRINFLFPAVLISSAS